MQEFWIPKITDRYSWSTWESKGSKDLVKKAKEEAEKILKEHEPLPLDEDVLRKLNVFIKQVCSRISKTKPS
jgi:trimethylamine:corrinoid methyltransferase-like protein